MRYPLVDYKPVAIFYPATFQILITFLFASFQIKVGKNVVVPAYSKVSLPEKPSNEDSDEEFEYADTNYVVTDSPCKYACPKISIIVHTCLFNLFL